jgi:hypothetical protein
VKSCSRCNQIKEYTEFGVDNGAKDKHYYLCLECNREYQNSRGGSRTPTARRAEHFRLTYKITLEDYQEMFDEQGGRCAICGTAEPGGRYKVFNVDHNHDTGDVRGLLCGQCNTALGLFKDDSSILLSAIRYLEGE